MCVCACVHAQQPFPLYQSIAANYSWHLPLDDLSTEVQVFDEVIVEVQNISSFEIINTKNTLFYVEIDGLK